MPSSLLKFVKQYSVKIGGRKYKAVKIGNQLWMAENLDYKFPKTESSSNYYYYSNDETTYGRTGRNCGLLYNWYASKELNDNRSTLLPDGWHIPSRDEWNTLLTYVGGASTAGAKLKASNLTWAQSWGGTDDFGLGIIPSGGGNGSSFSDISVRAAFPTLAAAGNSVWYRYFDTSTVSAEDTNNKGWGMSIRLIKTL